MLQYGLIEGESASGLHDDRIGPGNTFVLSSKKWNGDDSQGVSQDKISCRSFTWWRNQMTWRLAFVVGPLDKNRFPPASQDQT